MFGIRSNENVKEIIKGLQKPIWSCVPLDIPEKYVEIHYMGETVGYDKILTVKEYASVINYFKKKYRKSRRKK